LDSGKVVIQKERKEVKKELKLVIRIISTYSNSLESLGTIFRVILRRFGVVMVLTLYYTYDTTPDKH